MGPDDERGTLNLIDASVVRRAVATVTAGEVLAFGTVPLPSPGPQPGNGGAVGLRVYQGPGRSDALDTQTISPHGFDVTHLDAVGHSFYHGLGYNGRRMEDLSAPAAWRLVAWRPWPPALLPEPSCSMSSKFAATFRSRLVRV